MDKQLLRDQIIADMHRRYATKKYDPTKKLAPQDWATILEVGRLSPSSYGYEPWKFVLLDTKTKHDIYDFAWGAQASIDGADKVIAILARKDITYNSPYVQHLVSDIKHHDFDPNSPRSQRFKQFQEHDLNLDTPRARFDWACRQTYIALGNMLTAAGRLDIDSCPIEGFDHAKMDQYFADHGLVDPEHWGVAVMASFGYRPQEITPKKRQPLADIYQELWLLVSILFVDAFLAFYTDIWIY